MHKILFSLSCLMDYQGVTTLPLSICNVCQRFLVPRLIWTSRAFSNVRLIRLKFRS